MAYSQAACSGQDLLWYFCTGSGKQHRTAIGRRFSEGYKTSHVAWDKFWAEHKVKDIRLAQEDSVHPGRLAARTLIKQWLCLHSALLNLGKNSSSSMCCLNTDSFSLTGMGDVDAGSQGSWRGQPCSQTRTPPSPGHQVRRHQAPPRPENIWRRLRKCLL